MWPVLLQTFLVIFLAEMGDKSQFLMIAMSAEYRLRDIIAGVAAAVCVLNLLAIAVGSVIGNLLPMPLISLIAGMVFLVFAITGLRRDDREAETFRHSGRALPAIFGTYFLAELGDKTQLTALTLAADGGDFSLPVALAVFLGASAALLGADLIGLFVGFVLGRHLPVAVFGWVSFLIFTACGVIRLLDGLQAYFAWHVYGVWISVAITAAVLALFLILCIILLQKQKRSGKMGGVHDTGGVQSISLQ